MKCNNCSNEIPEESKFCLKCGNKIDSFEQFCKKFSEDIEKIQKNIETLENKRKDKKLSDKERIKILEGIIKESGNERDLICVFIEEMFNSMKSGLKEIRESNKS